MLVRRSLLILLLLSVGAASGLPGAAPPSLGESETFDGILTLAAPIDRWDEAIPLGNGLIGGLLWGEGNEIRLSLDRGDLWDERLPELYSGKDWNYDTIRKLKAAGRQDEISRLFDHPYNQVPYPTKLPGGRLVITLDGTQKARSFSLDIDRAVGTVDLGSGDLEDSGGLEVFFSALEPVALIRHRGPAPTVRFLRPEGLTRLGYDPAVFGRDEEFTWMTQEAALGLCYAVVVGRRRVGEETLFAIAITTNGDGKDPCAIGKQRVGNALDAGYDPLLARHLAWWKDFRALSSVTLPDERLQRHYDLVRYFYGAASRPDSPPMPLQGLWTRDDGNLPPWKGDYHHDLNTQMTYRAYPAAGLFDAGLSFINCNWNLLPAYRRFARSFYGVEGAAMPGVATLAGRPTAGWSQYALSPVNALWVGQAFDLHWRHTMDRDFLACRAYPWLSEIALGVANLLEEQEGKLFLPLSSSPEIHDNSLNAWLEPNSNYDLSLLQWAFDALADMADILEKNEEAARWRELRGKLDDLLVDEGKVLMFARNEPFSASHRHHSHTMAIHPLGTLHVEGSDRDRAVIHATLDRMIELGTQAWTGYSFSWFSCLLARAGRAEQALDFLADYERAFILRNGFHANGDQIGAGLSRFRYRPFTLEGNFLAMEAVHEMLLQSWGGKVRVFPAVSKRWKDVAFDDLRAEGGFKVSARREGGRTTRVCVEATVDSLLVLKNPFGGRSFQSSRPSCGAGDLLRCELKAGERVILETSESLKPPERRKSR
jgi:alpha-L-fucosidase 2